MKTKDQTKFEKEIDQIWEKEFYPFNLMLRVIIATAFIVGIEYAFFEKYIHGVWILIITLLNCGLMALLVYISDRQLNKKLNK